MDEFQSIAQLFRPLTGGAPEALDLLDDAAAIPARPGYDLIVTKDAMVAGVHFLTSDPPDLVARKLLRVNLSDLAAKGAEPYAYFLAVAWPTGWGEGERAAFAAGLKEEQTRSGLRLLGGDTVSTPGPFTMSATMLGWVPAGGMVKRSGARAGDVFMVSGTIGDGGLGLSAARGEDMGWSIEEVAYLADRYRLPTPRNTLLQMLRTCATAAADVSDGLLADVGHIALASGVGMEIDLERVPLSRAAAGWCERQSDRTEALLQLTTGGDDYEVVFTVRPQDVETAIAMAASAGVSITPIGRVTSDPGVRARLQEQPISVARHGWTHPA